MGIDLKRLKEGMGRMVLLASGPCLVEAATVVSILLVFLFVNFTATHRLW